jgi:glycosyltransferase involved in cell wall biosynthesis
MKIAVYHNLHSGGAKRTLCAITGRLGKLYPIDLYDLSCSDHKFCDLSEAVQNTYTYPFQPLPQLHRPFGRLNYGAQWMDLIRLERLHQEIAADIDSRGYDVVYVHPCQFAQTPGIIRYLKTPTLYHSREPLRAAHEPEVPRPYRVSRPTSKFLDRFDGLRAGFEHKRSEIDQQNVLAATTLIANSYFTREAIWRIYGADARVVYHGIDSEKNRPLGLERENLVLSVGALTPLKGFDFIVRSLALIPAAVRPALIVASNYQEALEKQYVEDLARQFDVKVQLLNMVSDEVLLQLYNRAQVVACASILEPFGLVPLEAMACAAPVVAVAEGGLRESVQHGATGYLVDRNPAEFAAAVAGLVTDPQLARRMGTAGRELVLKEWTWEKAVGKLSAHLEACLVNRMGASIPQG